MKTKRCRGCKRVKFIPQKMEKMNTNTNGETRMTGLSFFVPKASNRKLGPIDPKTLRGVQPHVAATYASIAVTCPKHCCFKGNGCYAEVGFVGLQANDLQREGEPLEAALEEMGHVFKFLGASKQVPKDGGRDGKQGRDLRLHVSGDAKTNEAARTLAYMEKVWRQMGGGKVWTYTHAFWDVKRDSWGDISVLASCETPNDVFFARCHGYTPVITVRSHRGAKKAYSLPGIEGKIIPCPAETHANVTCVSCRLCFDDKKLASRKNIIAFEVHGDSATMKKAKRALPIIDSLFGVLK